jgi:hypothetical protein
MIKYILTLVILFCFLNEGKAQSYATDYSPTQIQIIMNDSSASEGDIYRDSINDIYYLGTTSGSLRLVSDFTVKKVSNEQCFQDNDYYFITMKININEYKVIRYDKTDVNIETVSEGTGAQPITLLSLQALVYI